MKKEWIDSIVRIAIIIFLFIFLSYILQNNLDFFKKNLDFGFFGMLIFVILLVLSIVVAPVSALPFFSIASNMWGWITAGILGVIGWTLGSVIAFVLARKYGVELVKKVLPIKKIYTFQGKISEEHLFWTVVFLTMVVAADGISYFFGLFSKISLRNYTLATIIGLIPFTFAAAYLGALSFNYMIAFFTIAMIIFIMGWFLLDFIKKKKFIWKK